MKYKLIASDIDGTLLNSKLQVSPENILAIKTMIEKGIFFVPSSGRTYREMPDVIKEIAEIRYFICSNGSVIYDRENDKKYVAGISRAEARKVLDIVYSYDTHLTVRHNSQCYVDLLSKDEAYLDSYNVWLNHKLVIKNYSEYIDFFKEFAYSLDNAEVFSVFFKSDDDIEDCRKRLDELGFTSVVAACEHNLEIMHKDSGKANALARLSSIVGVDIEETISVGDSDNDTSMIEAAGLGLAVGNAIDSLIKCADRVICTNDEHIVLYILENIIGE